MQLGTPGKNDFHIFRFYLQPLSHLPVLAPPEFAARVLRPTWTTHAFLRWSQQHTWQRQTCGLKTLQGPMSRSLKNPMLFAYIIFDYICMTMPTLLQWTHDLLSSNTLKMDKFHQISWPSASRRQGIPASCELSTRERLECGEILVSSCLTSICPKPLIRKLGNH
jgi:hypothetical protein